MVVVGWPFSSKDASGEAGPISSDPSTSSSPGSGQGPLFLTASATLSGPIPPPYFSVHHRLTWNLRPLGLESSSQDVPGPCSGDFVL